MILLRDKSARNGRPAAPGPWQPSFAVQGFPGPRASQPLAEGAATHPSPPLRVALVVDDDELTAMVIAEHCRSIGLEVREAYHPRDALDMLAQQQDIEAIISDVRMPVMSGPEMVRRAIALRPTLAIVYVTGYALEDLDGALAPWPVLRKPFDLAELGPALGRASGLR